MLYNSKITEDKFNLLIIKLRQLGYNFRGWSNMSLDYKTFVTFA